MANNRIYIVTVPKLLKANGTLASYGDEVTADQINGITDRADEGYVKLKSEFVKEEKEKEAQQEEEKEKLEAEGKAPKLDEAPEIDLTKSPDDKKDLVPPAPAKEEKEKGADDKPKKLI